MESFKRNCVVVLGFFILAALSPARGQDQLAAFKAEWRAQRYKEVLRPLLDYRDSFGDGGNFEVDYMIGTAMCHLPDFTQEGIGYLQALPTAYGNDLRFDGRAVNIRSTVNEACGCAGVDSKSDSAGGCAGIDSKSDSATRITPNPRTIRDNVKRRLNGSLMFENNFDRPGQDYRSFGVQTPQLCRNACAKDASCKAFTFVRSGSADTNGVCWLKRSVPARNANPCCISGVK
jgi:hypothetical protein